MSIDQKLRDNTKLVYHVINDLQYIPDGVDKDDLEQIGMIALWEAIEAYDESCGYALSTCCCRAIHQGIVDYLRKLQAKKRKEFLSTKTYECSFEGELVGSMIVAEIQKYLSVEDYGIFCDKFVGCMTFDELEKKYSMTTMQLRYRVDKAKKILREKFKWEE